MLIIKSIYSSSLPLPEDLQDNSEIFKTANYRRNKKQFEIVDFLSYLYENNEIEIYYLLLNNKERKNFSDNKLEIISLEITKKIKQHLEDLLFIFSKEKFEVVVIKEQPQKTLKSQLIDKIGTSNGFSTIKKHFPDSTILDILFN